MRSLPDNQKKVLEYLLNHPAGATHDELVPLLGITKTAVKEHVAKLQSYGYLSYEDERGSVGKSWLAQRQQPKRPRTAAVSAPSR